jgi:hypothetical protein
MKRVFILMVMLATIGSAGATMTYGQTFYRNHTGTAFSRGTTDPLYMFIGEVEDYLAQGTGSVFYVDSGATGTASGLTWTDACLTLDAAVNKCTADNGDRIYVAAGHAEDLDAADDVDIDVAGVTIIGCGEGELRPTFTYTNAAGEIVVGADDVTIYNIICNASVTTVLKAIDVEAGAENVKIVGCKFGVDAAGTDEFNNAIVIGDASDGPQIIGCDFWQGEAAAVSAIYLDHGADDARIIGNYVFGDYSTACIVSDTAASLDVLILDNILFNGVSGGAAGLNTEPTIELLATTTGVIAGNVSVCNVATPNAAIVAADCFLAANEYSELEGGYDTHPIWLEMAVSATNVPVADSLLDILHKDGNYTYDKATDSLEALSDQVKKIDGVTISTTPVAASLASFIASGGTSLGTQLAASKSLVDAIGTNGTTVADTATGVAGMIGVNDADNAMDTSSVVSNSNGSVYERLESIQAAAAALPVYTTATGTNYLAVTVAFDGTTGEAHWGNAGETDEIFTVTGAVRMKILAECTETCTGTDGGTIALWAATNEDILIAATTVNTEGADNTNLDAGEIWLDTSPTEHSAVGTSGFFDFTIVGGLDVGLDCQTQDIADGTIIFHCWWSPLDSTGAVAAGAGGTL